MTDSQPNQSHRKYLFALIPLLTILTCGEIGTRVVGSPQCQAIIPDAGDWDTMQGDAELLWKLEPNRQFKTGRDLTRINSVGLREALLPTTPKKNNEKRIAVTGDSSIYGWGVEDTETYAVYLEKLLNQHFNFPIEVINLGVPGYSTEQTLKLLDKVGWDYQPDLLVVSNIFSDCNIDAFQDRKAMSLANPEGNFLYRMMRSSRLYCAMYMPWANFQANLNQSPNRVLMPGMPTGPNAAVTLENINKSLSLSRVPIATYLDNLSLIQNQAKDRNAHMLLAPLAQEWDVGIWNVPMPPPDKDHVLPWFPYREAQAKWASEHNIDIISFPEIFAAYPDPPAKLFVDHMHPSKYGTYLMAQAVSKHIIAHPELLQGFSK